MSRARAEGPSGKLAALESRSGSGGLGVWRSDDVAIGSCERRHGATTPARSRVATARWRDSSSRTNMQDRDRKTSDYLFCLAIGPRNPETLLGYLGHALHCTFALLHAHRRRTHARFQFLLQSLSAPAILFYGRT